MAAERRIVVGISGASGIVYGVRILELLRGTGIQTHLVVSRAGDLTRAHELAMTASELRALADVVHAAGDLAAPLSSGSFRTLGMIVAPCSVKTLAEIATGATSNLLSRAADVVLKERRRLVLVVRESPLNLVHLRNMVTVTEAGGIIVPPVPAFYTRPRTLDDVVTNTAARVLDLFDIDVGGVKRWGEDIAEVEGEPGQDPPRTPAAP